MAPRPTTPSLRPSAHHHHNLPRLRGGAGPSLTPSSPPFSLGNFFSSLQGSGVLTSVSIPIVTSTLALGLLILLTNSYETTTKRRGGAPSALATTAAAAVLLLVALQLGQPSGALGAVFFAAGALLAWAGGRSESPSDGAATPGSARRASLRSAAMTTALCALALALLAPALIALLLGEGSAAARKAMTTAASKAAGNIRGGRGVAAARSNILLAAQQGSANLPSRSDSLMCAIRSTAKVLAGAGAGAALSNELDGRNNTCPAPVSPPLLAGIASASSPAHIALPIWLAGGTALSLALGACLTRSGKAAAMEEEEEEGVDGASLESGDGAAKPAKKKTPSSSGPPLLSSLLSSTLSLFICTTLLPPNELGTYSLTTLHILGTLLATFMPLSTSSTASIATQLPSIILGFIAFILSGPLGLAVTAFSHQAHTAARSGSGDGDSSSSRSVLASLAILMAVCTGGTPFKGLLNGMQGLGGGSGEEGIGAAITAFGTSLAGIIAGGVIGILFTLLLRIPFIAGILQGQRPSAAGSEGGEEEGKKGLVRITRTLSLLASLLALASSPLPSTTLCSLFGTAAITAILSSSTVSTGILELAPLILLAVRGAPAKACGGGGSGGSAAAMAATQFVLWGVSFGLLGMSLIIGGVSLPKLKLPFGGSGKSGAAEEATATATAAALEAGEVEAPPPPPPQQQEPPQEEEEVELGLPIPSEAAMAVPTPAMEEEEEGGSYEDELAEEEEMEGEEEVRSTPIPAPPCPPAPCGDISHTLTSVPPLSCMQDDDFDDEEEEEGEIIETTTTTTTTEYYGVEGDDLDDDVSVPAALLCSLSLCLTRVHLPCVCPPFRTTRSKAKRRRWKARRRRSTARLWRRRRRREPRRQGRSRKRPRSVLR